MSSPFNTRHPSLIESHAGEFILEALLLPRIAAARQAVGEIEEALSFLLPRASGLTSVGPYVQLKVNIGNPE